MRRSGGTARRPEPGRLGAQRKKRRCSARVSPPAMARRDGHHTHSATDRFEVDPWRRVGGEPDLQTAACGGGDGTVGLSFETHHGGGVAPSPEFTACAASSWCTMTGRAITTAVASQRRNQPKPPPPQLKLDEDFREPAPQVPKSSKPSIVKLRKATRRNPMQEAELLMENPLHNFPFKQPLRIVMQQRCEAESDQTKSQPHKTKAQKCSEFPTHKSVKTEKESVASSSPSSSSSSSCAMTHQVISISCRPAAGRRGRRVRHVRLGSVLRLRVRLFGVVGLLLRCLEELNCCPRRWSPATTAAAATTVMRAQRLSHDCRRRRLAAPAEAGGESSFQAEAIADCLEFIKRSYLQPTTASAC
uniref:Uncharacterized protein n=1 Tax=Oryza meridionalis TaxID=40149 RepID=A0A0E0CH62_9ORYZ